VKADVKDDFGVIDEAIALVRRRIALSEDSGEGGRMEWVQAQHELGRLLRRLAEWKRCHVAPKISVGGIMGRDVAADENRSALEEAHRLFEEAISALRQAVARTDGTAEPELQAQAYGWLGGLLAERAAGDADPVAWLDQAIEAYQIGLQGCRRAWFPLIWAKLQTDLAIAWQWRECAQEEDDGGSAKRILAAITAYKAALKFYRVDTNPSQYGGVIGNLPGLLVWLGKLDSENRREHWLEAQDWLVAAWAVPGMDQREPTLRNLKRIQKEIRRLLRWAV
jgi:tetratricopeptide (TPR) repeat protein